MSRPSRRDVLGAGAFTLLTGIAAAAVAKPDQRATVGGIPTVAMGHGADVELIAIGREAAALIKQRQPLEERWWATPSGGDHYKDPAIKREIHAVSDAMRPIDDRLSELTDRAGELQATTREAMIAKALLIRHEMEIVHVTAGAMDMDTFDPHERLAWSLLEDLLGAAT